MAAEGVNDMGKFAEGTEVSVEKSRAEIEGLIIRYGATSTAFMNGPGRAMIAFEAKGRRVLFELPLPDIASRSFDKDGRGSVRTAEKRQIAWEQACRQRWRALALVIKAKLEAVETGISQFEDEFLANIVMPDGQTVSSHVRPRIAAAYESGNMTPLLPPPSSFQ
jgi:hypothetical protein